MSLLQRVGVWTLALTLFLAPLIAGFPAGPDGVHTSHEDALAAVRLLGFVGLALAPLGRPHRAVAWFAALAGAVALLSLLVHSRFLTAPTLLFAMVPATLDGLLCLGLLTLLSGADAAVRRVLTLSILASGALTALSCLAAAAGGAAGERASGLFFSPNFAAGLMGLCAPLALIGTLTEEKKAGRALSGALFAALLGGIAATGSRSALVIATGGALASLALIALMQRGRTAWPRLLATLGAGALLAGLVGFGVGAAPLRARAAGASGEQSGAYRTWTWKGTLAMAQKAPLLGHGPGTFPYLYPRHSPVQPTKLAHQSYLELAAERGFVALALTLAALVAALLSGLRRQKAEPLAAAALPGAALVGLARSLLDSEWAIAGNALPFFALVGLLQSPPLPGSGGQARGRLLLLLPALLALPPVRLSWPPQASVALAEKRYDEALKIEPSLRVVFPAARSAAGPEEAMRYWERGREIEPTNTQLLRSYAETCEAAGQKERAKALWQALIALHEGLPGQVRAIPEVTDTQAAWAYAALGQPEKAAAVIERYAATPPLYQQQEFAQVTLQTVLERRERLRALYQEQIDALEKAGGDAVALKARREETLRRFDALFTPSGQ